MYKIETAKTNYLHEHILKRNEYKLCKLSSR